MNRSDIIDASTMGLGGSTVLITGGTGSFGSAFARRLLVGGAAEVRILSRDETKQDQMRRHISDGRLRFYLGDVRDERSVAEAIGGVDYVFHAAALKQVPSCEFFPIEAVKTNVLGSSNVIHAAHQVGVRAVVCLGTDKAVYPVNAMGMTKGLMEKTVQAFARNHPESKTTLCLVRYGNVMHSRGSVIPLFVDQVLAGHPVTVTDPSMTRFMMTLEDAMDLVGYALSNAVSGDLFIKKAPASTINTLLLALANIFDVTISMNIIGVRHGEKMYETLATREELSRASDDTVFFRVPLDARGLEYALYFESGEVAANQFADFNSNTTQQLTAPELERLLLSLPEIQKRLARAALSS